jgi:hypothetical protein
MNASQAWTRNAIKSHLLASFQSVHRIRNEILESLQPGRQAELGPALERMSAHLHGELQWLQALGEVPSHLVGSPRAQLLTLYGEDAALALKSLAAAVTAIRAGRVEVDLTNPARPQATPFMPFGVAMLRLLAREHGVRQL